MRAHPEMVAGTGADDTLLMGGVPGLVSALRRLGVDAAVLDSLAEVPLYDGGVRVGGVVAAGIEWRDSR